MILELENLLQQLRPFNCRVLAVSKMQPVAAIRKLQEKGQTAFGENYVQEALEKIDQLKDLRLDWHLIGHLQSKKCSQVVGVFKMIHSVDSLSLASKLNRVAGEKGTKQKVLLQVNIAEEQTKSGFMIDALRSEFDQLCHLENLEICGLMCMPPLFENPEMARPFFIKTRQLRDELGQRLTTLRELSMGTSQDFLIAAQEGATMVRIGAALFGQRKSHES